MTPPIEIVPFSLGNLPRELQGQLMQDSNSVFLVPSFLRALELEGPGTAKAWTLTAFCGHEPVAYWALIEKKFLAWKALVAPAEPTILKPEYRAETWEALLAFVRRRRPFFFRMATYATLRPTDEDVAILTQHVERLSSSLWHLAPFGTFMMDLTAPRETIWKGVRSRYRRYIKAQEEEDIVFEVSDNPDDAVEFHRLSISTFGRSGIVCAPQTYYRKLLEELLPLGACRLFWARDREGQTLGGAILTLWRGYSTYLHVATRTGLDQGFGKWFLWKIIEQIQGGGAHTLDLGGVSLNPDDHKQDGIRNFKQGFGGHLRTYHGLEAIFAPRTYHFMSKARHLLATSPRILGRDSAGQHARRSQQAE